jgi:Holliday junction resolvase
MRRCKVDRNQKEIVEAFRRVGFSVLHLHTVGKGCPDICVGKNGKNYLIEIKDGTLSKSKRELTEQEQEFHDSWRGQVAIIESLYDVIKFTQENS